MQNRIHPALVALKLLLAAACTTVHAEPPSSLRVMTFNVLRGGTARGQPLEQTAKVIREAKADVAGLQEIGGNLEPLAKLLGWSHAGFGSKGIVTRFEITAEHQDGVRVKLDSGREADVFNVHLRPAPYQPYQLLKIPYHNSPFLTTEAETIKAANAARGDQVAAVLKNVAALADDGLPVFLTGDFNEPSHLDWTKKAADKGTHPIAVAYPASTAVTAAGFRDAWRTAHPDELTRPGFTWTPLTKPDDPKDHHDRIDFVYFKGDGIRLGEARVIGEDPKRADVVITPYPSDHRAVVAEFVDSNGPAGSEREP
ncbi:endonuclease/exonuclease/phosphatase family protein [Haloferula helveola]|uniref:Endonuclease/exonuclease/phosphatase family protein n=1 Tax=Haloferula helveola TaxID=490095 RepID=A0ABM7RFN9_9BACT|nr:endonuclease/exonuclease/phosphatase family protein [Haloferula helveola]